MNNSTLKLWGYIFEKTEGFGNPASPTFKPPKRTPKKPTGTSSTTNVPSSATAQQTKPKPLIDTGVMGSGGTTLSQDVRDRIGELSQGSKGIFQVLGPGSAGAGLIGAAAAKAGMDIGSYMTTRSALETRAQQEGIYNMTNVRQFYKNLGSEPIPLRPPPGQEMVAKVLSILTGEKKTP